MSNQEKSEKISREEIISILNEHFSVDKWMDSTKFTNQQLKNILTRLILESYQFSKYNGSVADENDSRYGKNFSNLSSPAINALSICKEYKAQNKIAKFLDVGSGSGSTTWKALLAGCEVTAVDINFNNDVFIQKFNNNVESIVPTEYLSHLVKITSPISDLLSSYPEYKGYFDIVYSARVIHFLAPKYFHSFASSLYQLTKNHGKAYVIADSVNTLKNPKESGCYEIYLHYKSNHQIAPGYIYLGGNFANRASTPPCFIGQRDDITEWDDIPSQSYKNGRYFLYTRTFDIDSIKEIFEGVNYITEDVYDMGGKILGQNSGTFIKEENGDFGVVIELLKHESILDEQL